MERAKTTLYSRLYAQITFFYFRHQYVLYGKDLATVHIRFDTTISFTRCRQHYLLNQNQLVFTLQPFTLH
jgi:hypothetical protein